MGDIKQNIEQFKQSLTESDRTSSKIQTLALLGYDSEVEASLLLLGESPMTSILVEQCHASGAQIMARHQQLGHEALCACMTVHNSLCSILAILKNKNRHCWASSPISTSRFNLLNLALPDKFMCK